MVDSGDHLLLPIVAPAPVVNDMFIKGDMTINYRSRTGGDPKQGARDAYKLNVNVANSAVSTTNSAVVSGGGDPNPHTANDPTTINPSAVIVPPSQIATTASGLLYSRVSKVYTGTLTLTNISGTAISGPLQIVFTLLPSGVTLSNATGSFSGSPFLTVPGAVSLAPGASVTVPVRFSDPSNTRITFTPVVYSGSL